MCMGSRLAHVLWIGIAMDVDDLIARFSRSRPSWKLEPLRIRCVSSSRHYRTAIANERYCEQQAYGTRLFIMSLQAPASDSHLRHHTSTLITPDACPQHPHLKCTFLMRDLHCPPISAVRIACRRDVGLLIQGLRVVVATGGHWHWPDGQ